MVETGWQKLGYKIFWSNFILEYYWDLTEMLENFVDIFIFFLVELINFSYLYHIGHNN